MIWMEVIKKYGVKTANKMAKSQFLQGITVSLTKCAYCGGSGKQLNIETLKPTKCVVCNGLGKIMDIPDSDIWCAYKDVIGEPVTYWD